MFVCKEIKCELPVVIGGETGFVLSCLKENMELNGAHYKGERDISSGRVGSTKPPTTSCSHRVIAVKPLG